jgi:tetratricopeptide (TPR) repeat protein
MKNHDFIELQFPLASNEIRLLAELGFMAAASGQVATATEIFESLIRLRPTKAFPYVGKAVALLYVGSFPVAIELLAAATQVVETDQEQIWIYLALAFQRSGLVGKARIILNHLLDSGELSDIDATFVKAILKGDTKSEEGLPIPFPVSMNDTSPSFSVVI